jgi:hypothetical protein
MKLSTKKWLEEVVTLVKFGITSSVMILRPILQDDSLTLSVPS